MLEKEETYTREISFKEFIIRIKNWWSFIITQWLKIAIIFAIAGLIGYFYASNEPIKYNAKISFIVEDAKNGSSGFGGLASLAGQFGLDVGGNSVGGSLFSGENIMLYFKSTSLAREVLLTKYDSSSNKSLADEYASIYGLKSKWQKDKKIGKINFPPLIYGNNFSRLQDSLLQKIIDDLIKKEFFVLKTDKKAGFIEVSVIMQDEVLAKVYCERIVQKAVEKYVTIKTQRQKNSVDKLELRVDSIAALLRTKTVSGAQMQTLANTMDINPLFKTNNNVAFETMARDKTLLATIFASATQSLELAKFTLNQETPVIQIVDSPVFPLKKIKVSRLKTSLTFSFLSSFIFLLLIVFKRIIQLNTE